MIFNSKRNFVYVILAGIFITNAIVAEMIGGKIIQIGPFIMSIGILPWPVVFITTDLINEYFGKSGVRKLSLITASLIAYVFIVLFCAMHMNAASFSTVSNDQFQAVFGQSMWIIVGSLVAFLTSQLVDVFVFWALREKTGGKFLWLRSTGSTVISQLVDTFIVEGIAFWLPGKMTTSVYINSSLTGYTFKLIIAVLLTPLIYFGHNLIEKYIGHDESEKMIKTTAQESLHHKVLD